MDHAATGGAPLTTVSPTKDHPQSSDLADSAEPSGHAFLARALSAPTHATKRKSTRRTHTLPGGPPHGKVSLPFHRSEQPKEKLPDGIPIPSLERMFTGLLQAPRPVGDAPPILGQLRNIATYSWLNLLLVFIPISWAAVSDFPLIFSAACMQSHTPSPTRRNPSPCAPCGTSPIYTGSHSSPHSTRLSLNHTATSLASLRDGPFANACLPCSLCIALREPQFNTHFRLLLHRHRPTGRAPRVCHGRTRHPCRIGHRRFAQCNVRKCC
jgi:hypothetical protein